MTLLRRAPREIYRVYSEEEYLGGTGSELIGEVGAAAGQGCGQRRLQRVAGAAMLAGAVGAVSCLVVLNIVRHGGGLARGGIVAAATRPTPIVHAAAFADAQPQVTSSRPATVRAVETKRSRVPPIGRSLANPVARRPAHLLIHLPVRRQIDVAVVAGYVPHRSSGEVHEAPVSAPASTATASTGAAPTSPPVGRRPEFGFER
jgi:hypothetical protein